MNKIESHDKFIFCFFGRKIKFNKKKDFPINCAYNRGDSELVIKNNRKIVSQYLNSKNIILPNQIHSNIVLKVDKNSLSSLKADALITSRDDILLGILTADCAPIIILGVKYFGIIHAGWKGLINQIIERTIIKLNKLGENIINLNVFVGPHLKQNSFEVKSDFLKFLKERINNYEIFILKKNKRFFFDFSKLIKLKLLECKIKNFYISNENTFTSPEKFFSHRYCSLNKIKNCGRQISLVGIKNNYKKNN